MRATSVRRGGLAIGARFGGGGTILRGGNDAEVRSVERRTTVE
jgi:hypothetical protein